MPPQHGPRWRTRLKDSLSGLHSILTVLNPLGRIILGGARTIQTRWSASLRMGFALLVLGVIFFFLHISHIVGFIGLLLGLPSAVVWLLRTIFGAPDGRTIRVGFSIAIALVIGVTLGPPAFIIAAVLLGILGMGALGLELLATMERLALPNHEMVRPTSWRKRWASIFATAQRNPTEIVEIACVLTVFLFLLLGLPDGVLLALTKTITGTFHSAVALLSIDRKATLATLAVVSLKLLIGAIPLFCVTLRSKGWARGMVLFRLPLVGLIFPFSCFACATPMQWVILIVVSALASFLSSYRPLQWTWVAPLLLLASPSHSHLLRAFNFLGSSRSALQARCDTNAGVRPSSLPPSDIGGVYYGFTPRGPDEALLTGVTTSLWLQRTHGTWSVENGSRVRGIVGTGCLVGKTIWTIETDQYLGFISIARNADGSEKIDKYPVPTKEADLGYLACRDNRVFTSEVFASHVWEISGEPPRVRRLKGSVGGWRTHLQLLPDGMLAVRDTSGFSLYSPDKEEVTYRMPASVMGWAGPAVCDRTGDIAITDMLGRVRFFTPDGHGAYQFSGGVSVFAARYGAFSPDCRYFAVGSGDDETVSLIDVASLKVVRSYRAGPWISGVLFTGPREMAVVDTCTMSSITF